MADAEVIIGLVIPVVINFLLLYNKYDSWYVNPYKWYAVYGIAVTATVLLYGFKIKNQECFLALHAAQIPLIILLIDDGFKKLSILIHKRDYYMRLRGTNYLPPNLDFCLSDRLFSAIMMSMAFIVPIIILFVYRR